MIRSIRSLSANTRGSGFYNHRQTPPPSNARLAVLCTLVFCAVLSSSSLFLRLCDPLIVCCAFLLLSSLLLAPGGHLRVFGHFHPRLLTLLCLACLVNRISPSHPDHISGSKTSKTQHPSQFLLSKSAPWGRYRCSVFTHELSRAHHFAANPEGSATFSIRVAMAIANSTSLAAVPSAHTKRTDGSIMRGSVEHIHTRPTR